MDLISCIILHNYEAKYYIPGKKVKRRSVNSKVILLVNGMIFSGFIFIFAEIKLLNQMSYNSSFQSSQVEGAISKVVNAIKFPASLLSLTDSSTSEDIAGVLGGHPRSLT